jgi:hypothetical protein
VVDDDNIDHFDNADNTGSDLNVWCGLVRNEACIVRPNRVVVND